MNTSEQRIAILDKVSKKLENALDLDPLIEKLSDSQVVLLGEASHGTHEYYTWRTAISKRLIEEHGFNFIAVEGDWPDFYRVNRYVKHYENCHSSSVKVLKEFNRWPTWMWANWEIEALTNWLHAHNEKLEANERVGIYGLDVYSLWESMEAIIDYLMTHDLSLVPSAKRALGCFEPFGDEKGMAYARSLKRFLPKTCETEVVTLLQDIKNRAQHFNTDIEASLNMEQNAYIAKNAEAYYRSMVNANQSSWNLRDHHMMDTLKRLLHFHGPNSKAIIWEHNTHVGDARATDMALDGSVNVGQLVRQQIPGHNPKIVGFGSYKGTVVAGAEWGAPMRNM
ncbi:MAG: erythromycin esterase family protein, partial [Eudoraea sp.]|uniref:erythromycin esterase family protein n=1 Tax=Eudoraea sp. TaxID=1979955 RepID=UPI003C7503D6